MALSMSSRCPAFSAVGPRKPHNRKLAIRLGDLAPMTRGRRVRAQSHVVEEVRDVAAEVQGVTFVDERSKRGLSSWLSDGQGRAIKNRDLVHESQNLKHLNDKLEELMHDLGLSKTQFRKAVHEANICLRCMKTFVTEKSLQQHIHAVGHSRKKKAVKNYEFARFALILIW